VQARGLYELDRWCWRFRWSWGVWGRRSIMPTVRPRVLRTDDRWSWFRRFETCDRRSRCPFV